MLKFAYSDMSGEAMVVLKKDGPPQPFLAQHFPIGFALNQGLFSIDVEDMLILNTQIIGTHFS